MKYTVDKVLVGIITVILPFILLMGAIRLVMIPQFPTLEYQRPGFPLDPYGFSMEERKEWASYAVTYLTNDEGIDYLQKLHFQDGSSLFNESELEHMEDVKQVVKSSLTVWYALIGVSIGIVVWFLSMRSWKKFSGALRNGAWLTVGLIIAIVVMLAVNFDALFDQFHRLFFSEGTWLFYANDTLIRLFPLVFWRDAFLLVGVVTLIAAGLILWLTHSRKAKKRSRAHDAQSESLEISRIG
ncbi:MAG: TIGR01906 family membrane protein [Anaerolineaceae bacterium]